MNALIVSSYYLKFTKLTFYIFIIQCEKKSIFQELDRHSFNIKRLLTVYNGDEFNSIERALSKFTECRNHE